LKLPGTKRSAAGGYHITASGFALAGRPSIVSDCQNGWPPKYIGNASINWSAASPKMAPLPSTRQKKSVKKTV
jgi:hypothetical protein